MKNILFILSLFLFTQLSAQENLQAKHWQEDLRFLQNTVHKEYSHLFVKTTKEAFDAEVATLYKNIPNLESHEIVVGMAKITSLFKYGHTGIFLNQKDVNFHSFPFNLYEFKDDIYIQGVHKNYKKALGAKVLKVNNMPIEEALEKIASVTNSENSQDFKAYGINYLGSPEVLHAQKITKSLQNAIVLTLEKNGKVFTESFVVMGDEERVPTHRGYVHQNENWLDAREQSETPLYLKHLDKIYYSKYLDKEKAMYIRHSRIADDREENTKDFYNRVFDFVENNDVEKLIIDVRLNGGGNSYLNKSIITGIIETKKINKVGSLYVIIGKHTYSAAQNLVNELHNYTNAIFVGEPTAENVNFWGDARPVTLPNSGIVAQLSYAWWQGKPAWEYTEWLAPQVPVKMSYLEYASNQDPVLDAALSFSGKDFILNPMQYIRELYMAGDAQKLATEIVKMIQDPRYAFFDFEAELSKSAHRMLGISSRNEEKQAAIQIFSFITQLFPNSIKAYKNLAEAYLEIGDKEKAKALLNKTIAMDPNEKIAKNIKEMLHKN